MIQASALSINWCFLHIFYLVYGSAVGNYITGWCSYSFHPICDDDDDNDDFDDDKFR